MDLSPAYYCDWGKVSPDSPGVFIVVCILGVVVRFTTIGLGRYQPPQSKGKRPDADIS
jgi:hypothetical protein